MYSYRYEKMIHQKMIDFQVAALYRYAGDWWNSRPVSLGGHRGAVVVVGAAGVATTF